MKQAGIHCIMIFQGDIKYVSYMLGEKMQPKLIHDDSVCVCKQGMLISLAWSVIDWTHFVNLQVMITPVNSITEFSALNTAFSSVSF